MRHVAWLNAVPEEPLVKNGPARPPAKSRIDRMKDDGIEPDLPEISAEYLIAYLWDAGPALPGAAGPVPLTHSELLAWQENTGIVLAPWETRMLRRLSADYISESGAATKPNAKPPFGELYRNPNLDKKLDAFLD